MCISIVQVPVTKRLSRSSSAAFYLSILLWFAHGDLPLNICFHCANSLKSIVTVFGWHLSCNFSWKFARVTCPCDILALQARFLFLFSRAPLRSLSLHDLVQVCVRRSCGDLGRLMSKRAPEGLVEIQVEFFSFTWSCTGPCAPVNCEKVLRTSYWNPALHDLVQCLARRSRRGPGHILPCPCIVLSGLCEQILWGSCSNPP